MLLILGLSCLALPQAAESGVATAWDLYGQRPVSFILWNGTRRPQYYALKMLQKMETAVWLQTSFNPSLTFATEQVGNVSSMSSVPRLAILASRNIANDRLTLAVINRDLNNPVSATIQFPSDFTPSSTTNHTKTKLAYNGSLGDAHNETVATNVVSHSESFTWTPNFSCSFDKHSLTVFEFTK